MRVFAGDRREVIRASGRNGKTAGSRRREVRWKSKEQ